MGVDFKITFMHMSLNFVEIFGFCMSTNLTLCENAIVLFSEGVYSASRGKHEEE